MSEKQTDQGEDICTLCSEHITIYAIGKCDHKICFKCSTRMRVLCDQMYCAICRSDLPKVTFTEENGKYTNLPRPITYVYRKKNIFFQSEAVKDAFHALLAHPCRFCENKVFKLFRELKDHMRREHNQHFCDICVAHLKIFSHQRKCYDRTKLAQHRRVGDEDDKSYKGHPLCEFCDDRYLDKDELLRHLRKDHYFCHFCEADGVTNEYYKEYESLKEHFRESHYLCEEDECCNVQFTNSFRSDIDLKAHKASAHSKGMKRSHMKQARTLDIEVNLAPRSGRDRRDRREGGKNRGVITGADFEEVDAEKRRQGRGRGGGQDREERRRQREKERVKEETARAIAASVTEMQKSSHVHVVDEALLRPRLDSEPSEVPVAYSGRNEDFPSLDGKTKRDSSSDEETKKSNQTSDSLANKVRQAKGMDFKDGNMSGDDFPVLGNVSRSSNSPSQMRRPQVAWTEGGQTTVEDFPVLGKKTGQPQMQASFGTQWTNMAAPKSKPAAAKPQKVVNLTQSLNDFPSLGSLKNRLMGNASGPSLPPGFTSNQDSKSKHSTSVAVKKDAPKPKQNIIGRQNDLQTKTKETSQQKSQNQKKSQSITTVAPSSASTKKQMLLEDEFPSMPASIAPPTSNVQIVKASSVEPTPKRGQQERLPTADDFPSLGKSSKPVIKTNSQWGPKSSSTETTKKEDTEFQKVKTKGKKGKNGKSKAKVAVQNVPSWMIESEESEKSDEDADKKGAKNQLQETKSIESEKKVSTEEKEKENTRESSNIQSKKKQKKKKKLDSKNAADKKAGSESESSSSTPKETDKQVPKMETENNVVDPAIILSSVKNIQLDDFPALQGSNKQTVSNPPPGFNKASNIKSPPPGFGLISQPKAPPFSL